MKLSRTVGCALAALVHLAGQEEPARLSGARITLAKGLPEHFLLKVLVSLARAGVLTSDRGPHGGYRLARPARDISLLEVVEAVDGPLRGEIPRWSGSGTSDLDRRLDRVCREVALVLRGYLRGISLAELADGQKPRRKKSG